MVQSWSPATAIIFNILLCLELESKTRFKERERYFSVWFIDQPWHYCGWVEQCIIEFYFQNFQICWIPGIQFALWKVFTKIKPNPKWEKSGKLGPNMERRGQKTLYEKTSRASVSYIRGKEADIGRGKKLARKLNGPGREISRNDIFSWLCLLHFNFAPL